MRSHVALRVLLPVLLMMAAPSLASASEPSPGPDRATAIAPGSSRAGPVAAEPTREEDPLLWLSGPFGSVPDSLTVDTPPGGLPVDAFVRRSPLRVEAGHPGEAIADWLVTATSLERGAAPAVLARNGPTDVPTNSLRFAGPDRPGRHRISAHVVTARGRVALGEWIVAVPDREPPADGLLEVPAPELILTADSAASVGWRGAGCYVYLCVEVGRLPPLRTLERLDVHDAEVLRLRLSDGSAVASWEAALLPITSGLQKAVKSYADEPLKPVPELSLEAPEPGEWLLMVEVVYDRERGWSQTFYRLTSR